MRFRAGITAIVISLSLFQPAASGDLTAKIAIAYDIGFLGDNGYNDAIHAGLELAKERFNLAEPLVREVPTSGSTLDRLTRLRFLAKSGYTLIIAVGSGYRDTLRRVSREYPTIQFALINDRTVAPLNISNIYFDESIGAYLAGAIAALQSKSKSIAIVEGSPALVDQFKLGAQNVRKAVVVKPLTYNGNLAQLDRDLGDADVIYSMWDKDANIYKLVTGRAPKSWYIARIPDQYFVSNAITSTRVIAAIRKDYRKPILQLVKSALTDSAVIDILDESGIYGREYSVKNGAVTVELSPAFKATKRITTEIAKIRETTNQG